MGREFHSDAAGLADAFADAVRELDMVAVAGGEVIAGLRDADDRLAGLELGAGEAVVQIALQIERRHARIVRVVEPFLRTKVAASAVTGGRMPIGWLFCHWFLLQCKRTGARHWRRPWGVGLCDAQWRERWSACPGGSFPPKFDTIHGCLVT